MQKNDYQKLRECPFCGGKAEYRSTCAGAGYAYVKCTACNARTGYIALSFDYSTKDVAIEAWNRRVNDEDKKRKAD